MFAAFDTLIAVFRGGLAGAKEPHMSVSVLQDLMGEPGPCLPMTNCG